jgi:CMP-N-acetylneuraminic acid synthetase
MLQPTSPLRTSEHIKEAIDMFLSNDCDSVVSVASVNGNHPFRMKKLINNQLINFIDQGFWDMRPRQELPEVYIRNGAIYLINKDQLLKQKQLIGNKCLGYIMNDKDSINIDSEIDLILADLLIKERQSK